MVGGSAQSDLRLLPALSSVLAAILQDYSSNRLFDYSTPREGGERRTSRKSRLRVVDNSVGVWLISRTSLGPFQIGSDVYVKLDPPLSFDVIITGNKPTVEKRKEVERAVEETPIRSRKK